MNFVLGAATVLLLSISPSASAATIASGPAETGSMMLIGAGLVIGATVVKLRTRRG